MSCVDEQTAEKVAKRKALGRLGALRGSVASFRLRVGDDWLFGFVKTKFGDEGFHVAVKLSYVDCKGVALERIPPRSPKRSGNTWRRTWRLCSGESSAGCLSDGQEGYLPRTRHS
jgi:hypothetical protein